jgi:trehalose synthase
LKPFVELYDYAIFTLPEYANGGLKGPEVAYIHPAIDPLSPKNSPLAKGAMDKVLAGNGIDPGRPMIAQISRFDPWKDPLGVIDAYRAVKKTVPDLQLVMVAAMAGDDPEGWVFYEKVLRRAGEDPDIHFLTDHYGLGNDIQVNAIQTKADVVVQKSIREGFGLTVTEALWKSKPVVAGDTGGIRLQVLRGETGFLASSMQEFVQYILYVLAHWDEAQGIGNAGKEHVRRNFLITRLLRDYLRMFNRLSGNA